MEALLGKDFGNMIDGDFRRDPDQVLQQIKQAEGQRNCGKLKIFFGYAAGVGKTYAMLEDAHLAASKGFDVVVGYVEPHARPATTALLDGLEVLPLRQVQHKGITLHELDLDAVLQRKPQIVLVDELAHTNAPGSRHKKRYSDVEELLRAGISVFTTVNVQHLESLNDKVAAITQISVKERIPDHVFDRASQVELIDIEPDDLIDRLNAGKIYAPERAATALGSFFTGKNLKNLREIALRRMADRMARNQLATDPVHAQTREDVLVYVTEDAESVKVIRAAASMAQAFYGSFTAVVVEASSGKGLDQRQRAQLRSNIDLAEELGARVVVLQGDETAMLITQYCMQAGITQVVIGGSKKGARFVKGRRGLASRLTQLSQGAVINVVPLQDLPAQFSRQLDWAMFKPNVHDALLALGSVAAASAVGLALFELGAPNTVAIMLYLMCAVVFAGNARGFSYAPLVSLGGMLAFNFLFTMPRFTFNAYGISYPLVFTCMLVTTLLTTSLTVRMKRQMAATARRAYRTDVLLQSSRQLQLASSLRSCFDLTAQHILKLLDKPLVIYECGEEGIAADPLLYDPADLGTAHGAHGRSTFVTPSEHAVAAWVAANNEQAGATTETLVDSHYLYLPIQCKGTVYGVAGLAMAGDVEDFGPFEKNLLVMLLDECGQAAERVAYEHQRRQLELRSAKDALRSNMLRVISHDLRTPLTSISGYADVLRSGGADLPEDQKRLMYDHIGQDAAWLINLVENLLSAARMGEDSLELDLHAEVVDDVVRDALSHVSRNVAGHTLDAQLADDLLMARMDARLVSQVVVNLVNNAFCHTPAGCTVQVRTERVAGPDGAPQVRVLVADNGPGIPHDEKTRVFDLFYNGTRDGGRGVAGSGASAAGTAGATGVAAAGGATGATSEANAAAVAGEGAGGDHRRGMGVGLALCQSIVAAHGSTLELQDAHPHGSVFSFCLPLFDPSELLAQDQPS